MINKLKLKSLNIKYENEVLRVFFNRPNCGNALNELMINELLLLLENVKDKNLDGEIKVIVFEGESSNFMAGGDIGFFKNILLKNKENLKSSIQNTVEKAQKIIDLIYNLDVITISKVQGICAGFGLSIICATDFALCSKAIFKSAYIGIALSTDGMLSYNLTKSLGAKKAKEILILNEIFTEIEALKLNIINKVVATKILEVETQKLIDKILDLPTQATLNLKHLVNKSLDNHFKEHLKFEEENFIKSALNKNFKIGIDAFLNKEKANFN